MTILITRRQMLGDIAGYIARLESLLAHLKAISHGDFPSHQEIAAAPMIDDYRVAKRPAPCLVGDVARHPTIDGEVTTSDLWVIAPELGWARTYSRLYALGRPSNSNAGRMDQ